jgi:hypothetical protein
MMDKKELVRLIVERLQADLELLERAARAAHEAATHAENVPDNKYETLALEASYIAQGQANRAQQIRLALADYQGLEWRTFAADQAIRLTALVSLDAGDGALRTLFLGPAAGGLKVLLKDREVTVITPESPLGSELLGRRVGDEVESGAGAGRRDYEIVAVT